MSRSLKKPIFVCEKILEKIKKLEVLNIKKKIKTYSGKSAISPQMVGYTFLVHNGHKFVEVKANAQMVFHKLGEFIATRKLGAHGKAGKR